MPDYVRIGPPYGQINELNRPFVNTAALASGDVARYGAAGWWGADKWGPAAAASGPGSAIASWSITPSPGLHTQDASGFYNVITTVSGQFESRQWQIYNATTMPPNQIIAVASVILPYMATGMMVFEMVGGATFAAFPVVPEFSPANSLLESVVASANGSVIGSAVPAAGSAAIFEMSRVFYHSPVPTFSANANEETNFGLKRFAQVQFRTVGTVASGAMLRIQYMRLAVLPVPWVGTNAGPLATAALAQASSLVGTWYNQIQIGIHLGQWGISRLARYPAMATIDAQQPNGAAYEIGSTIVAGQAQWGSDLVQKNYAQSLLSPGDPLAFERIPNRNIVFPYISRSPSGNSHLFQRDLERAIKPGNVIDVIPEDAQTTNIGTTPLAYRRFDIIDGRVVNTEDIRYQRAGLARGEIQIQTLPYPRSASFMTMLTTGSAALPNNVFMPGEVPAPAFYTYQGQGQATGPSFAAAPNGFMSAFVPSIATYLPVSLNPTSLGNSIASMPNGFRVAGSQINFGMTINSVTQVARGWYAPGQQEALAGRVRVFAVIANASAATIPLQLTVVAGGLNQTQALSQIGYSRPLYTAGSEMRQLAIVDLGEVRIAMDPLAMGATVQWSLNVPTGAASTNATAGVFDSMLFMPIGNPKGWFGAVGSSALTGALYIVTASNTLVADTQGGYGQPGTGQGALPYLLNSAAFDVSQMYQGRSPYLPPGQSWVWTVPLAINSSFAATAGRPFSTGSTANQLVTVYSYPRWLFLQ